MKVKMMINILATWSLILGPSTPMFASKRNGMLLPQLPKGHVTNNQPRKTQNGNSDNHVPAFLKNRDPKNGSNPNNSTRMSSVLRMASFKNLEINNSIIKAEKKVIEPTLNFSKFLSTRHEEQKSLESYSDSDEHLNKKPKKSSYKGKLDNLCSRNKNCCVSEIFKTHLLNDEKKYRRYDNSEMKILNNKKYPHYVKIHKGEEPKPLKNIYIEVNDKNPVDYFNEFSGINRERLVLKQLGPITNDQFVVRLGKDNLDERDLVDTINSFLLNWKINIPNKHVFLPGNLNDCLSFVEANGSFHLAVLGIYYCTPFRVDVGSNIKTYEQRMIIELLLFVLEKSGVSISEIRLGKLQWSKKAIYDKFKMDKFPLFNNKELMDKTLVISRIQFVLDRLPTNILNLSLAKHFRIEGNSITMEFSQPILIFNVLRFYGKCRSAGYQFESD